MSECTVVCFRPYFTMFFHNLSTYQGGRRRCQVVRSILLGERDDDESDAEAERDGGAGGLAGSATTHREFVEHPRRAKRRISVLAFARREVRRVFLEAIDERGYSIVMLSP